ncbi:MAG: dynamin family protein [Clostridium sp.]|nr:dynamin family protein [Clostridium sp.]
MQNVTIKHNPYKLTTVIQVNGEEPEKDSQLIQYLDQQFQLWVDKIPGVLVDEYNDDEFIITFFGTELDYQDLLMASKAAEKENNGLKITIKKMPAKEFGDKEADICKLFEKARKLPFDELQSPAVKDAFDKALNDEFEVNVVATMSAGKSTLINALLGKKLMPSKNGACTATITKIKDDDDDTFKADAYDSNRNKIAHHSILDYKIMSCLNKNPDVSEINVSGNIPFVASNETSLILIDTPGPDNARDKNHGLVTAKALDQSSKMLVLFVMNGSKLHDEAQDAFLKRIAKSMSVGGKQARERFLFVINKLDAYDEEDDDIAGETIPDTIQYLDEMGIKNPNIFPAAAYPALLIRRYQSTHDEGEKQKILRELKPLAEKLVEQKQLHLEQYPNLAYSCQAQIDAELQEAIKNNDILGQALIHSGIRGIEETIRMYVTKYCRPLKIKTLVDTFKDGLDSAEAFEQTKHEIASREKEQEKLQEQIECLEKKLTSKTENDAFKKRIAVLEITTKLRTDVDHLIKEVQTSFTNFFSNCKSEMEEDEALQFVKSFSRLAGQKQDEFQITVERLLDEDIKEKSRSLLDEYIKKLVALSEEFSADGLSIDLTSFVKGKLTQINSDTVMYSSLDSRIETHDEQRSRTVTKRAYGWERLRNPLRWFKPEYETTEYYTVEVKEEITFISKHKLFDSMVGPVINALHLEKERILSYADKETNNIKEYFMEQFDEVDLILAAKAKELREATGSKEASQKALEEANKLLACLNEVKNELDAILEI